LQTVPHGNVFVDLVLSHKKLLSSILQAPELELKPLPDNLKYVFIGDNNTDANLVITWSCNSHAKTPIPGKPSKSGLIGVWHKDNLYLSTNTIENGNPHPMNIDSWMKSIGMTPRSQLFFNKSFTVLYKTMEGRLSHQHTHTHTQSAANKKFY